MSCEKSGNPFHTEYYSLKKVQQSDLQSLSDSFFLLSQSGKKETTAQSRKKNVPIKLNLNEEMSFSLTNNDFRLTTFNDDSALKSSRHLKPLLNAEETYQYKTNPTAMSTIVPPLIHIDE